MKAVILAAGEGSRMRPLTYTVPKPLTAVAGKPILEWIIESVADHVDGVVLIVGHLREKIMEHFGSEWRGMSFQYVHQAEQKGTGHALQLCRDALADEERFFVIYGDNISAPVDMKRCTDHSLSALALRVEDWQKYGIFKTNDAGDLVDLIEKPSEFVGDLANAGVYVFDQQIFEELDKTVLSERGEIELTDAVLSLAKRAPMRVIDVTKYWLPIGYRDDVAKAEPILLGHDRGAEEFLAQRKRTLTAVMGLWRRNVDALLAGVSDTDASKSPAAGRMSILDLARHQITAERLLLATAKEGKMGKPEPPTEAETATIADVRALLARERKATMDFILGLSAEEMDKVCVAPLGAGDNVYLTVEELCLTLTGHECWHAGQISGAHKMIAGTKEG